MGRCRCRQATQWRSRSAFAKSLEASNAARDRRIKGLLDPQCSLLGTVDYAPDEWQLQSASDNASFRPAEPHFSVNDLDSMSMALREGAGIGLIAGFTAMDDLRSGSLERVLPQYHTHARSVYALYPSRRCENQAIH
ncbi:LysR substrate-binding domain-containing protein [Paraburkholderia sp. BL18I3N2]|uniref:LysR substrate-binding domain-containing protein n=1 Tax=Paraburkholderia sp. BL18I3N2 TaxID=1938799 RepID=UPI0021590FBC|nr:LysR substrate-binding domain-containing protein [Paraburkholderia sp. BL18I3N2]